MDGVVHTPIDQTFRPRWRRRTLFVSLPDESPLRRFFEEVLRPAVARRFGRLDAVSFLGLRQGKWMSQLEHDIAFSNAVVAFVKGQNPNVMLEVGRALAHGKPVIPMLPTAMRLPSMLGHQQAVKYAGRAPSEAAIDRLLEAVDEAVFGAFHRERSDERMEMQQRLLLGSELASKKKRPRRAKMARPSAEERKPLLKAMHCYERADFQGAVTLLEKCLEEGIKTESVFHMLADTWFLNGEAAGEEKEARQSYEELLRVADHGLAFCPGSHLLRKDRGLGLSKVGRFSDAIEQFDELLKRWPVGVVYYNLACVHALMGNKFTALSHLERSIELESRYRGLARIDPDFDPIWTEPMFQALVFWPMEPMT